MSKNIYTTYIASGTNHETSTTTQSGITSTGTLRVATTGNTHLAGAVLAAIDEEGQTTSNMTFSTGTLTTSDIVDENSSENSSYGVNGSLSPMSSVSVQASDDSAYGRGKVLATLGQGTITLADQAHSTDIDTLNRDTSNSTLELYDFQQQGADVDMTLDTRLLSKEGRKAISEDIKTNEVAISTITDVVTEVSVGLTNLPRHLTNNIGIFSGIQKFAQQNPDLAKIINDPTTTDAQRQAAKQQMVNYIAKEMGIPPAQVVQAMSNSVPNPQGENGVVKGAHTIDENGQSVIVQNYDPRQIDAPNVDKMALSPSNTAQNVTNLGHENQHAIDAAQGVATTEDYAKLQGKKQTDYFSFALNNYNLGAMNTGNAQQDAAYIGANQNSQTTQAGNVLANGINPEKTDYRFQAIVWEDGTREDGGFNATMMIWSDISQQTAVVDVSTWSNPKSFYTNLGRTDIPISGAADGTYDAVFYQNGYKGGPGILINGGREVPTYNNEQNPVHNGRPVLDEMFMHSSSSTTNRGSRGCATINCTQAEEAFNILLDTEPGTITIIRNTK